MATSPLWGVFEQKFLGIDQGTDWGGFGAIPALAAGTVTNRTKVPIREGGTWPLICYELDSPAPGGYRFVYVMENFVPLVSVGQKIKKRQTIGDAAGRYPYIEVGFAKDKWGDAVAPLGSNIHAETQAGKDMYAWIQRVVSGSTTGSGGGGGGGSTGGGGGGALSKQAPWQHGWHAVRRALGRDMPRSLEASKKARQAALQVLGHKGKVR